jgi:hypothetical protein
MREQKSSNRAIGVISSDWTKINIDEVVPRVAETSMGGLQVNIGSYEIRADEHFSMEKLAELLRRLEVESI